MAGKTGSWVDPFKPVATHDSFSLDPNMIHLINGSELQTRHDP
jgi:hypothetical protein